MVRLNLKTASLLDASGELGEPARQKLALRIIDDPEARRQHEAAQENLSLLQILPIPEPSAAERRAIPAMIKLAIRRALTENGAPTTAHRSFWHAGFLTRSALALAACAALVATLHFVGRAHDARQNDRIARINAAVARATITPQFPLSTDNAANTGTASAPWPLTPTLSFLHDSDWITPDYDVPVQSPDPSSPPG